jgi:hypothetical protein
MKKSKLGTIYIIVCFALLLVPLVGMSVAKTTTTTEKRTLADFPAFVQDGKVNVSFLSDLGDYFDDHFAFKNQLVAVDSTIQSKVFKTSSVNTVVKGTNGWLYLSDSVDDYQSTNTLTERQAYDVAHNLLLVQQKLKQNGIDFYFTVAPNKNSLYGENMPYYLQSKTGEKNNYAKILPQLTQEKINYINLFSAFQNQNDVLYLKQDSHWNENGAVLAYNTIMNEMGVSHNDFSTTYQLRTKTKVGDLATALYSVGAVGEWDSEYQYDSNLTITNGAESWEDEWVETTSNGEGSLLMFRDSFGNTLSPLIAENYKNAYFSKNTVYFLDSYIDSTNANTVLFEIVERNLDRFVKFSVDTQQSSGPPIMAGIAVDLDLSTATQTSSSLATIGFMQSNLQPNYNLLTGVVDNSVVSTNTNIYVEIEQGDSATIYQAFLVSNDDGEGYLLYLPSSACSGSAKVSIIAQTNSKLQIISSQNINLEND